MTGAAVETDTLNATSAIKQPAVGKWKAFTNFLYNPKDGTVLGRTGKSWLQITIFYTIFYGVLAAFFAVLLILFLQTLDPNQPKWQGSHGLIGSIPGMGFRPTPAESGNTLIWLGSQQAGGVDKNIDVLIGNLNSTLANYEPGQQEAENFMECPPGPSEQRPDKKVCKFNLGQLSPCTKENNFGFYTGQPCVLIKLNRIFGWEPESFDDKDASKKKIPDALRSFLEKRGKPYKPNIIYVTCDGEDNVDKEHIGPVDIHPDGFGFQYYPYTNSPGYLSPVVMVQMKNPAPGVIINVECKAWAANIEHSRVDRLGQVHFEIKVDR
jgi:sodium/potassium-transporting ATPase subunit beta